jgi:hypothetical protein
MAQSSQDIDDEVRWPRAAAREGNDSLKLKSHKFRFEVQRGEKRNVFREIGPELWKGKVL